MSRKSGETWGTPIYTSGLGAWALKLEQIARVLLDPRWVYILPVLHLAGCILTAVTGFEWMPVVLSEFPAGILLLAVAWRFGHPMIWFGVFGTLWWCWLSRKFYTYLSRPD